MPFSIIRQDITQMQVQAIVNPTDSEFKEGQCLLTRSEELPSEYIIHTIGPQWIDGKSGEPERLKACYQKALELAMKEKIESIAFPLIASGLFRVPKRIALQTAVRTIREFLENHEIQVYLVVFDKTSYEISNALNQSVNSYIDEHYVLERPEAISRDISFNTEDFQELSTEATSPPKKLVKTKSLEEVVNHLEESFSERLLRLIDERQLKDPEVYKKANVTKQTFSKIRHNKDYKPTKPTALAFAIALKLNIDETKDLLLKAGYALSRSSRFDLIISYFIEHEQYDIFEINEVLFAYDEPLLCQ